MQKAVFILTCLCIAVPFATAQDNTGSQHPDQELRGRIPQDSAIQRPAPTENEGILGDIFPHIHGGEALHFDYTYTGGVFNNARGGAQTSHSTRYVGIFDLSITADTEKLGLWKNGTFYTHSLFSHGANPSNYVGDWQGVTVFAYETPAQVSEYWYEHRLLAGAVAVRGGKMDAGVDFFYLDSTENFMNASGTCVPTTGIPTAPANAWGLMTTLSLTEDFCFKFGVFDADANASQFWMSESGNVYTSYQFDYHYNFFRYLPGFAYVGAWHDNSENTGYADRTHRDKSGYSVGIEQMVYRHNYRKKDDLRGLTVFAQFSQPQADRENDLFRFWGLGLRWLGLFENRPNDVLGFGVFSASFDRVLRQSDDWRYAAETAYELHYHAHVSDNIAVQPVLQYVVHPGGQYKNSLVPGFAFQVTF